MNNLLVDFADFSGILSNVVISMHSYPSYSILLYIFIPCITIIGTYLPHF